jgi:valyl-tRNA synthetase
MGCSCDWDRQRFTMDPICARAVREAFFRLFRDGLIYRGKRLVNWDPVLQTAIADDEIENLEIDGNFYYLRYPLVHPTGARTTGEIKHGQAAPDDAVPVSWGELARRGYRGAEQHKADDEAYVTVATTRPETYLGDTAVAINPHDPRAKALRGLFVELPLVGRVIPIIEDEYVVMPAAKGPYGAVLGLKESDEPEDAKAAFATGFLKVTPAHDPNDYELGRKHNLPMINAMAADASISDKHGWTDVGAAGLFVGKKREEAR